MDKRQQEIFLKVFLSALLFTGAISIILGVLITPDFVASQLSPDGILEPRNIQRIQNLQLLAKVVGVFFILFFLFLRSERLRTLFLKLFIKLKSVSSKVPVWGYLLIVALATYCANIIVTSDMTEYLDSALNIFLGKGYVGTYNEQIWSKPPGFPFMIAGLFWLFGPSIENAFWVIRIFAVLNPLMVYVLAAKLFDKQTGLLASLFCLTAYNINYWSYRHLDHIYPFFVLLGIFLIYKGLEEKKILWFILSGFAMGIGIWVKQIVLVFLPLPLLMLLFTKNYRLKRNVIGTMYFCFVVITLVSPWVFYISYYEGGVKNAIFLLIHKGGRSLSSVSANITLLEVLNLAKTYFFGLGKYLYYPSHKYSLLKNSYLAPLFMIAWVYVLISAFRKKQQATLLSFSLLLFSPILSHLGNYDLRSGRSIIFLLLSYIVLADLLIIVNRFYLTKFKEVDTKNKNRFLKQKVVLIFIILVLIFQIFADKNIKFWKRSLVFNLVGLSNNEPRGRGVNVINKEIAEWIKFNLSANDRIMDTWFVDGRAIYFFIRGQNVIFHMPEESIDSIKSFDKSKLEERYIFLDHFGTGKRPRDKIYCLVESKLLEAVRRDRIDYIILTTRRLFLAPYFKSNPAFTETASFSVKEGEIGGQVFQVNHSLLRKIDNYKTRVADGVSLVLKNWKIKYPNKYNNFKKVTGFSDEEMECIINREFVDKFIGVE